MIKVHFQLLLWKRKIISFSFFGDWGFSISKMINDCILTHFSIGEIEKKRTRWDLQRNVRVLRCEKECLPGFL